MNLRWPALCLALLFTSVTMAEIPPSLYLSEVGGYPVWVSGSEATSDGALRSDLFSPDQLRTLAEMMKLPRGRAADFSNEHCDAVSLSMSASPGETTWVASWEEVVESAETILVGQVVERRSGFYRGTPGTLYEVGSLEVLKGQPVEVESVLMLYRTGKVRVGKRYLCSSAARGMVTPGPTATVVLLLDTPAADLPELVVPLEHQIYFEDEHGLVSAPTRHPDPPPQIDDLLQTWQAILKEAG